MTGFVINPQRQRLKSVLKQIMVRNRTTVIAILQLVLMGHSRCYGFTFTVNSFPARPIHEQTIHHSTHQSDFSTSFRSFHVENGDIWQSEFTTKPYISPMLWQNNSEWKNFVLGKLENNPNADILWEQVRLEALAPLNPEPEVGPQLYQSILAQQSLVEAIVTVIANEIETELITSIDLRNLFLQMLTLEDYNLIASDMVAASTRSPSIGTALSALLFQTGFHALVCYRVGHRLWEADRKGLAYYLQSSVSRHYSADIHPACKMGRGIYLSTTAGVVIGETAEVGNDVSILQGVTLGGTGKERGDRHPKVSNGVILRDGATVLGNIPVGEGAEVTAKSIVTKPVPPLAIVSGVPAVVKEYRKLEESAFADDLNRHLAFTYLEKWKELEPKREEGHAFI